MSRTHASQDVYVGEDLLWPMAVVIDDEPHKILTVKARVTGHPSAYSIVARYTEVKFVRARGDVLMWTGLDSDGNEVQLAAARRHPPGGCIPCAAAAARR